MSKRKTDLILKADLNSEKKLKPRWLTILIVVFAFSLSFGISGCEEEPAVQVTVTDFSGMSQTDIDSWCTTNKVKCTVNTVYSETVAKGSFIGQSIAAQGVVAEGGSVVIEYSLGKKPSAEFENALDKAKSYSDIMNMSKKAIYEQLTSEYGEKFPAEAAQYAIDNLDADYFANALAKAKSYRESMSMSNAAIYDQLISEYGEKFTAEEAQYAIDHIDD